MPEEDARVYLYHDGTKHSFNRFARSTGYLDWASQPHPFRSFAGAPQFPLAPRPDAPGCVTGTAAVIGNVLRDSLGLSAWKAFNDTRWSLRVNPSSGNLHPTEAYIVAGPAEGLADRSAVYHYAADRHALEQRASFDAAAWLAVGGAPDEWLIALTSIHWRESWKYGERAFRYCQHDLGHAIAAIAIAAAMSGCRARLLPDWSQDDIAALVGLDRDQDFVEAEREEPGAILVVSRQSSVVSQQSSVSGRQSSVPARQSSVPDRESSVPDRAALLGAARSGRWTGTASQLSEEHVTWSFIDEVAAATRDPGHIVAPIELPVAPASLPTSRALVLQRRSAVAFDGRTTIDAASFGAMLSRVMPVNDVPWNAVWWQPRIHLALFVHRVDGMTPGLYVLARAASAVDRLTTACGREFLWERAHETLPLFLLARGDSRALSQRLSCDQNIAADGFFSLGMIADFDAGLAEHGPSFYRNLFWESGLVGQVLYLEAERAQARGTGIGCFYDDAVHDALGLTGHAFQSLYHFTIGMPVEDGRLTTEPGYAWE